MPICTPPGFFFGALFGRAGADASEKKNLCDEEAGGDSHMSYRLRAHQQYTEHQDRLQFGTTSAWGPRTGQLLERPQMDYAFIGRENSVMNEHVCLPNDVRKMLDILGEEPSMLSIGFFRRSNVERVHTLIVETVAASSRGVYKIGRQSDREVETLMLFVYQNNSSVVPGATAVDKVTQLNRIVATEAAADIIVAVSQYLSYMQQITSPPPTGPALPVTRDSNKSLGGRPLF